MREMWPKRVASDSSACELCSGSGPDGDGKLLEYFNQKSPGTVFLKDCQVDVGNGLAGDKKRLVTATLSQEEGAQHVTSDESDQ